jgi:hypothetical protein
MRQFRESLLTQVTTEPDEETNVDFTYEAPRRQRNRFQPTIPFSHELCVYVFHFFLLYFPFCVYSCYLFPR